MSNISKLHGRGTVAEITLEHMAGYDRLTFPRMSPRRNYIFGQNGAGKSTLIWSAAFALNFLGTQTRSEYILIRTYGPSTRGQSTTGARIVVAFRDQTGLPVEFGPRRVTTVPLHVAGNTSQIAAEAEWLAISRPPVYPLGVFTAHEDRLPKRIVGKSISIHSRGDANYRYSMLLGGLRAMAERDEHGDLREIFDHASKILGKDLDSNGWIAREIRQRSPRKARPLSCGQYDILALLFEACLLRREMRNSPPQGAVILLDAPETFVHPAALPALLDTLDQMLEQPQFIITTHSLKLLAIANRGEAFWIHRSNAIGEIAPVGDLNASESHIFRSLYGDDVANAVVRLTERSTQFLLDCAKAGDIVRRVEPTEDLQLNVARRAVWAPGVQSVLEYGAGSGDFLRVLVGNADEVGAFRYVGVNEKEDNSLTLAIMEARARGMQAEQIVVPSGQRVRSRVGFDRVVTINTLHEIPFRHLPEIIAELLHALSETGQLAIFEPKELLHGERMFVLWSPDDYARALEGIMGIECRVRNTFHVVFARTAALADVDAIAGQVKGRLLALIQNKQQCIRRELHELYAQENLDDKQQRRLGFLLAQHTHLSLAAESKSGSSGDPDDGHQIMEGVEC